MDAPGAGPDHTQQGQSVHNLANTPINVDHLATELQSYPDKSIANELISGFRDGFKLHYCGPRIPMEAKNLKSARENPHIIREKLLKEISLGRMAGPFRLPPLPNLRVSPIGLVKKKNGNDFRLIHNLSHPENHSVNDFIDPALCSVNYTHFDEAVEMVQALGKDAQLAKLDIKSAYRLLPISPEDFELLGIKHDDFYYFDKALPFGVSIACATFEKFSTFLEWLGRKYSHSNNIKHYLDDFLIAGKADTSECKHVMDTFIGICDHLAVPLASEKTEGPTSKLCFLGLEIDSVDMSVKMPVSKIIELRSKITLVLNRSKVTLQEMQSLIGSLSFACRAVKPGRAFIRRLINSTLGLKKKYHKVRVNSGMKNDLKMWLTFLDNYNGVTYFSDQHWVGNHEIELFSDSAAGFGLGFGVYLSGQWAYGVWPERWFEVGVTNDITILELFPIVAATFIWADVLKNKKICFRSDNQAVCHIINTVTSKSELVMSLVRTFVLQCLKRNILFKAEHIYGINNGICDSLSRLNFQKFRRLAPTADQQPQPVPAHLWSVFDVV